MTGRQRRRRKQLLGNLKQTRAYWKLKAEALDRSVVLEEAMDLSQGTAELINYLIN